jgi:hypothetical protein
MILVPEYRIQANKVLDAVADVQRETHEDAHVTMTSKDVKKEVDVEAMQKKIEQLEKENAYLKSHVSPRYDSEFQAIIDDPNPSQKGLSMEDKLLSYLKQFFPNIIKCSKEAHSCDLFDPEYKIKFECKAYDKSYSFESGVKKFNMDAVKAVVEEQDIRLYVYIAFSNSDQIKTHSEQKPMRFFLNAKDLSHSTIDYMKETSKYNTEDKVSDSLEFEYDILKREQTEREWRKHMEDRYGKPTGQSGGRSYVFIKIY